MPEVLHLKANMSSLELGSGKRLDEGIHLSKSIFLIRPEYVVARVRDANYVRNGDLCLEGIRLVLGYA
jgi:hypothetical protein